MGSCYIGIDIGSSFIKSAILDLDRGVVSRICRLRTPSPLPNGIGRRFEVDADSIVKIVRSMIDDHLAAHPEAAGVLLSTQMHGFVLSDGEGRAITPYISWQDERCMEPVGDAGSQTHLDLLGTLISPDALAATGIDLKPGLAMCNVFHWLSHNQLPDRGEVRFCTLGSYVIGRLTGEHVCHITNAAATGFADIREGRWNCNLIEAAGCTGMSFPDIRKENEPAGWYNGGAAGRIAIYPDIGDHQASVLGSFAEPERDAVITIGTAGIVSRINREFHPGAYEIRPYVGGGYLNTLTRLPGGRNLDVIVEFVRDAIKQISGLSPDDSLLWKRLLELADQADSNAGPCVSIGFFGNQRGAREGGITKIDDRNMRIGSILRGTFEEMSDIYHRQLGELLLRGEKAGRLVYTGGVLAKIPALAEQIGSKAAIPYVWSPLSEEALIGLYRVALVCSGRCRSLPETRDLLLADPKANRSHIRMETE